MVNNKDLYLILKGSFPKAHVYLTDGSYAAPEKKWVSDKLYFQNFQAWMFQNRLSDWNNSWDCDNFSFAFYNYAQMCHHRQMVLDDIEPSERSEGLAIGVVFYKDDDEGYHAINIVYTEDKVQAFEPQTGKYFELSQQEKESCYFVLC